MVHDFFDGKVGIGGLNDTNIVLIPKIGRLEIDRLISNFW